MNIEGFHAALLAWYRANARDLPWRQSGDPYRIWISEVMLQQTRVETVIPYYARFLARYPTLADLAQSDEEPLYKAWEGLGYYSRAKNLREAARGILAAGAFPETAQDLSRYPGFGPYTSAAVASIAFGQPVAAVDGNVLRVLSRLLPILTPIEKSKDQAAEAAQALMVDEDPGTWNQAMIELGALVCLPRTPRCGECPVAAHCACAREPRPDPLPPIRAKKPPRPVVEVGVALVSCRGRWLVTRRERERLLHNLYTFPLFEGAPEARDMALRLQAMGLSVADAGPAGAHTHAFTHRVWQLRATLFRAAAAPRIPDHLWATVPQLLEIPFPAAMRPFLEAVRA